MGLIYHIAFPADWKQAQLDGEYTMSTRGRTLEQQGFIHAGRAHQVAPVANVIYGVDDELLVLVIDEDRLKPTSDMKQCLAAKTRFLTSTDRSTLMQS